MNNRNIRKIISISLTIIIVIFFIYYFKKNPQILSSLKNISIKSIALVISIQTINVVFYATLNHIVVKKNQNGIPFFDNVCLQFANNFFNKLLPKGGAAFRGIYLKEVYNFPYSKFISSLSGLYVISFLSYSIAAFYCFAVFYFQYNIINWPLTIIFTCIFGGTILLILLPTTAFAKKKSKIFKVLSSILNGWNEIKKDIKFVVLLAIIVISVLLLNTIQMQIIYTSLGLEISYFSIFFLSVISLISIFLNITPDGIGIKEGIFIFSSDMVNIPTDFLILGSLVDRAIGLLSTLTFGGSSYLILMNKLNKHKIKNNNQ